MPKWVTSPDNSAAINTDHIFFLRVENEGGKWFVEATLELKGSFRTRRVSQEFNTQAEAKTALAAMVA